ncbi:uncharacterized protein SPAPADRAFT_54862 [Spathaspora passalidarum NRRL Y-27907]|uniref:Uncharacterized protein n=1 Tax=Spathaspora passalidarum (strain NRRL Y-27907 / 11-Y1) TaxID=619300 RepID=G3AK54_SPAPN|nr:uncharacterized protein SPAPADRAFT_54862 [Spathaspora passalidarum NRRL Y-27907]EGW32865.1 hypothetical protein SPAPADRAFT_54862 [Spathaspora passalidarum NRRL Y-27907]
MESTDPLPLIGHVKSTNEGDEIDYSKLEFYGRLILGFTWITFVVSINSFFELWKFVIYPFSSSNESLYNYLHTIFKTIDDYVLKLWCIYIVFWWWASISWCGLKLFRHSRGIQT